MDDFNFMLNFRLPDAKSDPELYLDALFEAGCDDASVGVGRAGMIGFDFTRCSSTAEDALKTAIENVRRAIPGAQLVQAGPDLVGLTEMAKIFGCTRQNMRKYATGEAYADGFPDPVISGDPSLWHLAEIASWLKRHGAKLRQPPAQMVAVSVAAARINVQVQVERVERLTAIAQS